MAERPLIAKLLEVDEYKERYHAILSEMLEGYMQQETFNERVAQLQDLISEHVKQDPRPFYSYEEYEQSIPTLTSYVQKSMDNLQQQLDGTLPPLAMEAAAVAVWVPAVVAACDLAARRMEPDRFP